MTTIHRSALVAVPAQKMYDLVNDIEQYSQFLPWCNESTVVSQTEKEIVASLQLKKGVIDHWFTTRNVLVNNLSITMELVEGPFHHLNGAWQFTALNDEACKIELVLDFEFKNKVIGLALGPVFNEVANKLVDVFSQRAQQLMID